MSDLYDPAEYSEQAREMLTEIRDNRLVLGPVTAYANETVIENFTDLEELLGRQCTATERETFAGQFPLVMYVTDVSNTE